MKEIFAKRLKNARTIAGLSMQELALKIGISKQMISKYEKALSLPDSSILIKLANALQLKPDYFFKNYNVDLGKVEFRKKSALSVSKSNAIKESILVKMENYLELEGILTINYKFKNPISNNSALNYEDAERVADELRNVWELGFDPIHNVISILEDNQIKVIEVDEESHKFDGLSTFIGGKYPVIVVNKNFLVERKRFTLLHELAHLLLEIPANCERKKKENICNRFAGAMLLPGKEIIQDFGIKRRRILFNELIPVQKRFGISLAAIIYRLVDTEIISKESLRHFYINRNNDVDLKEFVDESRFKSEEHSYRYERLVYKALAQEVISTSKASSFLNKSVSKIKQELALI